MGYSREDYWADWQAEVVALLQIELAEVLPDLKSDEIDWVLWQKLFDEGRGPRAAIDRALARD